jgi:hypothetical protein
MEKVLKCIVNDLTHGFYLQTNEIISKFMPGMHILLKHLKKN